MSTHQYTYICLAGTYVQKYSHMIDNYLARTRKHHHNSQDPVSCLTRYPLSALFFFYVTVAHAHQLPAFVCVLYEFQVWEHNLLYMPLTVPNTPITEYYVYIRAVLALCPPIAI